MTKETDTIEEFTAAVEQAYGAINRLAEAFVPVVAFGQAILVQLEESVRQFNASIVQAQKESAEMTPRWEDDGGRVLDG